MGGSVFPLKVLPTSSAVVSRDTFLAALNKCDDNKKKGHKIEELDYSEPVNISQGNQALW